MPFQRPEEYDQLLTQFYQQTGRNPPDLVLVLTDLLAPIADYFFAHTDDIREETVFLQALICGRALRRILGGFRSQHLDDTLEATVEDNVIVLKPKAVVDRAQAWQQVIAVMDRVHANLPPSTKDPLEDEKELVRMVKDYR